MLLDNLLSSIKSHLKVERSNSNAGIYLGSGYNYEKGKPEKIRIGEGHYFCVGATGSGKTNTMIFQMIQDISKGKSVVYIDPKGESKIINKLLEVASMQHIKRYDDIMILNPFWNKYSARLNPLYCEGRYSVKDEVVNRIMTSIPETKEEFFRDMSFRILQTLVGVLSIKYGYENLSYELLNRYLLHDNLKQLCNDVSGYVQEEYVKDGINYFCNLNTEWYEKVIANASTVVAKISAGLLNYSIGSSDGSTERSDILKRLYKDKKVIAAVLIPSMKLHQTGQIAAKAIFAALEGLVSEKLLQNKKLGLRIYIDEARDVLFRGCVRLLTQGRAADCFVRIFSQSVEGIMESVGKDEVHEILQNCNNKIIHRCDGLETAETLLGTLADVPVQIASQDNDGESRTMGHVVKEIDPNDLARLRIGEYVLISSGTVKRGYCPEIENPNMAVTEDKSGYVNGILNCNYTSLASDNWLEDRSGEKGKIKRETNINRIYKSIEAVFNHLKGSYGKSFTSNEKNMPVSFYAGVDDSIDGCILLNSYILLKNVKTYIEENLKDLLFDNDNVYRDYISRYLINKKILLDVEGVRKKPFNIISALFEYVDEGKTFKNKVDCWIIKTDEKVINESFKLYVHKIMN